VPTIDLQAWSWQLGPSVNPGGPQRLFSRLGSWLVEADSGGKRFLFAVQKERSGPQPFSVALNWQSELKKVAPFH
jgi:hypothetical protein